MVRTRLVRKDSYNFYCLGATSSGTANFSKELPNKKMGRLLATGEDIDQQIQHYLTDLRKRGCIVNTSVAIAVGEGILLSKNESLSTDCLTKDWAKYLFTRMGLVKRKGNTKAKVDVEMFDEIKKLFHQDIRNVIVMDEVPAELVINWDQTGLNYVPVSQWTMAQEGAKRVEVDGKDDKCQITVIFGCSMSGDFLPPQLVYQGKTAKCLPSYQFPLDWNITHTVNHWLIEETMELKKYLVDTKRKLMLPPSHPALLLFDNFKGQCTEKLLKLLDTNMVNAILIPPNCSDRLQPLDPSVNKAAREFLQKCFQKWYALVHSWKEKHQGTSWPSIKCHETNWGKMAG